MKIECKDCMRLFPTSKIILIQSGIIQGYDFQNEIDNKLIYVCEKCYKKRKKQEMEE
jgi:hypothetical protein